ncbi:cobaltochelatase subunit CobN [Paucibacter sp. PLA-PC-4]|uniref:cobaltochelatase subunit CobN n=1 Tax=Paucibacter sp. PLA-PC-4 TaxID=2993655 RepID=UPI002249137A|nr:cobaltochelatase subunit CobN [Paucibacter sp. PLA-PC-4]MCX2860401.1 cobaltochelatase subunit CobN [Paucibacter sp. PLA-PC-4]
MRRFLTLLLAAAAVLPGLAQAATVLFVSASPVAPGKFVALAKAAEPLGLRIEARFAEKLGPDVDAKFWAGADLVLIDAPRQHIEDYVRQRLGAALPALAGKPHVWLPTVAPKSSGLPEALAQRLHAYYVNGGRSNLDGFLRSIAAHLRSREGLQDWARLPAPIVFPPSALYHPKLADGKVVLPTPAAYLQWRGIDPAKRPPVIGIAFHQQSISAEQTGFIDELIERIEAGGALAWPFYSPVMGDDSISKMVTGADGKLLVDVLINTQITLGPEQRRKEFEALGLPVIQAMAYRRGDAAAWAADPQGVQLMDVPFYLAQAEYAGITDIQIAAATRKGDEQVETIVAQSAAVVGKALNLVGLQRKSAGERKVAVFFWNYPAGEKNLSASFMNLPKSLSATLAALQGAGYRTEAMDETLLTLQLQRLLAPSYRPPEDKQVLQALLREGLADRLPLVEYKRWLAGLPESVQVQLRQSWGEPEDSSMLLAQGGQRFFVIPRLQLGHVSLLPQPGRGDRGGDKEKALYHSSSAAPSHHYMATYLWARQSADALVHYGTHGSQEWLPGKERGLSATHDFPMLAVGNLPVVYPYIVDNIGEATQARRRGRATIISHQTPPFAPAGLHASLTRIHDLLHDWLAQDEGSVRDKIRAEFLDVVRKQRLPQDMAWSEARIAADFPAFVTEVHDHLHELALTAQPMGLHTFGQGAGEPWRTATVLMMLGKEFWEGVAGPGEEADEMLVGDWSKLQESTPFRKLQALLAGDDSVAQSLPAALVPKLAQARSWHQALGGKSEMDGLLAALAGRYIATSYGGDPIKNPDSLPTGRNLYGFDPSRVPTQAAWAAGKDAMNQLIAAHKAKSGGKLPRKLTFTLWSVETMRHFGLLEAQALWALGVEPVWDAGGRVSDVKLIPRAQLGRPRVDIVLSATGLYRDHFPNVMRQLAKAAKLAAEAGDEADNPVATNARRIAQQLQARGVDADAARRAGQTRIFSSESGRYGTGLDDAALATDTWKTQAQGDRKLAELYLSRMQFAYGPDEAEWGAKGVGSRGADQGGKGGDLNLYAEHLRGTEGAVLARSSNLYGMLTTDDPFQYLGGIGLAVRYLDGKAPELYVSNLRGLGGGKVEGAAQFLAKELATRNFHPGYISGLMKEGYAGTLQVLDGINNFAGWQSVAREIVRHDQWQEFMDVYVRDKHNLGLKRWFESQNPHALAQSIERMLEAARQGQWQADAQSVAELKERWRELSRRHDVRTDNQAFNQFVAAAGFGLDSAAAAVMAQAAAAAAPPVEAADPAPAPPPIQGMKLDRVAEPPPTNAPQLIVTSLAVMLLLLLATVGGGWRAWRQDACSHMRIAS